MAYLLQHAHCPCKTCLLKFVCVVGNIFFWQPWRARAIWINRVKKTLSLAIISGAGLGVPKIFLNSYLNLFSQIQLQHSRFLHAYICNLNVHFSQANRVQKDIGIHKVYLIIHVKDKHQELNHRTIVSSPTIGNCWILNSNAQKTVDNFKDSGIQHRKESKAVVLK
jgi:hypothetical protein